MKSTALPPDHYAAGWNTGELRSHAEINSLGKRYAETHDQEALLELCKSFHPYLMKYLVMICRGHVPVAGVGANPYLVNRDTKPFLKLFLPKGQSLNRRTMSNIVKHFHLAFKEMEAEEIYAVLMQQLIAAINGYDPRYKAKVGRVVQVINHELSKRKQFRAADVRRYVEFDCDKHLRWLCLRGFLEVLPGREGEEGACFQRSHWPPSIEFLDGDVNVIGLAYYLLTWFVSFSRNGLPDDAVNWNRKKEFIPANPSLAWPDKSVPGPSG